MTPSPLACPAIDPTPIFEAFRGIHGTELLTAAVAHFDVFGKLAAGPLSFEALSQRLGLARRPAVVLITALRAMGLLVTDDAGRLAPTKMAQEHLVRGQPFYVGDYLGLAAENPAVVAMIQRLQTNRPAGADDEQDGAAFIYREGIESAMEREESARHLTLALAGRARNVAPVMAQRYPLDGARRLLDVGGGTGIYSIAWLRRHPELRAVLWDRPEVLKVADEMAREFAVRDRIECLAGDMFTDPVPAGCDVMLLSNVLHDWDEPQCQALVSRCAAALTPGGRLLIHDVYLNDAMDGPLPIALYSAALFSLTEGRAYSAAEYRAWLTAAGLTPGDVTPTLVHCGVLPGHAR